MKHIRRILLVVVALMITASLFTTASAEPKLTFSKESYEVYANGYLDLDAVLTKTDIATLPLVWKLSNYQFASISTWGDFNANEKLGEVTVTVTNQEKTASASTKVIIKENAATAITFDQTAISLERINETFELLDRTTITYADPEKPGSVDEYDIIWTSSDPDVATVGNEYYNRGRITATGEGTATITANLKNLGGTPVTAEATVTVTQPKLSSIAFTRAKYTVKYGDYSKKVRLSVKPVNITGYMEDVTFESSDEQIARVMSDGTIYPVKPGTVTITATYDAVEPALTNTTTVEITAKTLKKISLNKTKLTLSDLRKTYVKQIWFRVEPTGSYYDYKETYWETSDPDIVNVRNASGSQDDGEGYVYIDIGSQYGTATITAHVTDGTNEFTASCEVTVISKDKGISLDITKKTIYLHAGDNESDSKDEFYLTASNDAGDEYEGYQVKWSTNKKKVATVNKDGKVKAVKAGNAKITAKGPDGSTATCKVTVKKNLVKKIKGNKLITMRVGNSDYVKEYITTSPKWSTLYDPTFSFESSNDSVVSVNAEGKLKANGIGTAKITVKALDGSKKKFSFNVNVIEPIQ